jgi:hypothetical protein
MRKQCHVWPSERGLQAWDVDRLIAIACALPRVRVPLAAIRELDQVYWFDDDYQRPTCRAVLLHVRLIQEAVGRHPRDLPY